MRDEVLCGIYLLTNTATDQVYVGQSVNILSRWKQHRMSGNKEPGEREATVLVRSIRLHGAHMFRLSVIELCTPHELNAREVHWMNVFRPSLNTSTPEYDAAGCYHQRTPAHREKQAAKLAELAARKKCECGQPCIPGLRFCADCKRRVMRDMSRSGYLVRCYSHTPRKPNPPVEMISL